MNNEIRNQLIILGYLKKGKYEKDEAIDDVFKSIESHLHREIRNAERVIEECKINLKVLEEIKDGELE